jgi:hypothetical protein
MHFWELVRAGVVTEPARTIKKTADDSENKQTNQQ